MKTVTIKKADLLGKVRFNREAHFKSYTDAEAGYRTAAIDELTEMLESAKNGGEIVTCIQGITPQNHTDDYDTVIAMLEMSADETITLDALEFDRYVRDNWNWKHAALAANSMFIGYKSKAAR